MKFIVIGILVLMSYCCAGKTPVELPGIPLEVDPTMAIQAPNGSAGHACPVNGVVLTASHVLWDETLKSYVPAAWSIQNKQGAVKVIGGYSYLDLVFLEVQGDTVEFLSPGVAVVGDEVYWFEYDLRTRKNALRSRRRIAKVLREVAGHYIIDDIPVRGASGGCLLNNNGEVIGIISAGWGTDDELGAGVAVKLPLELRVQ